MFVAFFRNYLQPVALALSLVLFSGAVIQCGKDTELPPDVRLRYNENVQKFCRKLVPCMKEQMGELLAGEPERRDMVLGRMTRDLCGEEQFRAIGNLSVDQFGKPQPLEFQIELYESYERCTEAIVAAPGCAEVRETHLQNEDCVRVRRDHNPG